MNRLFVIDNYDSFTFNLVHMVEALLDAPVIVRRNDEISTGELNDATGVIFGPGPGLPEEAGLLPQLVAECVNQKIKTLGVCLGHQAIAQYFKGNLYNLGEVVHGRPDQVTRVKKSRLFEGFPDQFEAGRYHSWGVRLPSDSGLVATAFTRDECIMAFEHTTLPVFGVQFHPESVMTPLGKTLLENWLRL